MRLDIVPARNPVGFAGCICYRIAMDDAIVTLQIKAEHQAEEISALSKELYIQQKELTHLRQQLAELSQRFQTLQDNSGIKDISEETPPPHY